MDDADRERMMDKLHAQNHQSWGGNSPHNGNLDAGYRPAPSDPDGDDE